MPLRALFLVFPALSCRHFINSNTSFFSDSIIIPSAFMPTGIKFSSFRSSVCVFVRSYFRHFVEFASKFCVKVSQVVYISATTYQKANDNLTMVLSI